MDLTHLTDNLWRQPKDSKWSGLDFWLYLQSFLQGPRCTLPCPTVRGICSSIPVTPKKSKRVCKTNAWNSLLMKSLQKCFFVCSLSGAGHRADVGEPRCVHKDGHQCVHGSFRAAALDQTGVCAVAWLQAASRCCKDTVGWAEPGRCWVRAMSAHVRHVTHKSV